MAGERFEQQILDRLSRLGEVTSRPLFGGHGLYWRDTIFAIAYRGGSTSRWTSDRRATTWPVAWGRSARTSGRP